MMQDGRDDPSDRRKVRDELDADPRFAWFLRQKVTIPDRVAGYMDRPRLVERAMPTGKRLTVLMASGGFGKTTLLAECCRHLSMSGVCTAWVSIDENDKADVLDSYLAFAFRYAGLTVQDIRIDESSPEAGTATRVEWLMRIIEARKGSFVLALDNLHLLSDPEAVTLVDSLIQRGPSNLHVAIACRRLPVGLNVGDAVLAARASMLTFGDLRFSQAEIANFLSFPLSRRELASLSEESAGWPMALRIHRNKMRGGGASETSNMWGVVGNWVESRLWDDIDGEDRELLLDAGLFEWMDAELLDEVLDSQDAMRRLGSMEQLVGLLNPVRDGGLQIWRLHPLIREHCRRQRFLEARSRYREVHRRIATALSRRSETLLAMRHAVEAGDTGLGGEILEDAGALRLWIRHGTVEFQAAVDLLDEAVIEASPRLRLAQCVSLLFSGRLAEARRAYCPLSGGGVDPPDDGGADWQLWVDDRIVEGLLAYYGGAPVASERAQAIVADFERMAASAEADPLVRGYAEHALCIAHNVKGEFRSAEKRARRALADFRGSPYARMLVDFQLGQAAMARGEEVLARDHYSRAMRIARADHVNDPAAIAIAKALLSELELETGCCPPSSEPTSVPGALYRKGTPLQAYAAASGVAVGRALLSGPESALARLQELLDFVEGASLPALAHYLSAKRVTLLAVAGRPGDAERTWRTAGLPADASDCLDLKRQGWRNMEALSCAHLRLSIAQERFEEARAFAAAQRAVAAEAGLKRTLMRALALAVVLEDRAGSPVARRQHLEEFLALYAVTGYSWSAICESGVWAAALEQFLADAGASALQEPAKALLAATSAGNEQIMLTEREHAILRRLGRLRDKDISAELGLTTFGVRYHIRKLFAKLSVGNRTDAVRRAQELGLHAGNALESGAALDDV